MKLDIIIVLVVCFTPNVFASSGLSLGGNVGIGVEENQNTYIYSSDVYVGFHPTEYFGLSAGASRLDISGVTQEEKKQWRSEIAAEGLLPVNEQYDVYGLVGFRDSGDGLLAGVGMRYKLDEHWRFKAGYRWYARPEKHAESDDHFQFNLGFSYQFINDQAQKSAIPESYVSETQDNKATIDPIIKVTPINEEPEIEENVIVRRYTSGEVLQLTSSKACHVTLPQSLVKDYQKEIMSLPNCNIQATFIDYTHCASIQTVGAPLSINEIYLIVRGGWAYRIAREHCMTIDRLVEYNPWIGNRIKDQDYIYPGESLVLPTQ
ncbi:outer membrane beta-barrel protein [Vibrio sp. F13]|uniref:outer membrane beta-barrel protein n=1 Tax=Vibrio sp. F13 TaxID=2070777 RepID=UPI0010BD5AE8|nr:outer membrane beta-barrel protein [Vibrio sp. F13]TKG09027.1 porin family protein [Vibrio sp. F13]